jgi:hypothetical protein
MGDRKTLRDLRNQVTSPNVTQALLQKKRDGIVLDAVIESTAYVLERPYLEKLLKLLTLFIVIVGFALAMMDV